MRTPVQRIQLAPTLFAALLCMATAASAEIGQWDFNSGTLAASAGSNLGELQYFDGPGGDTELNTFFGTTASFGIPNINGVSAQVMWFPACSPSTGYLMPTPTAPNGTNDFYSVNSYTLIMDLLFTGDSVGKWRALLQTDGVNGGDADFFINGGGGIGISSSYQGSILSNTWHRVGIVFDKPNGLLRKYIDGALVGSQSYTAQDGRFSLVPGSWALLFTDEDNETAEGFVNSIQLRDTALTTQDMLALGGPSAAGIPFTIPVMDLAVSVSPTNLTGLAGMAFAGFSATAVGAGPFTYQWYRNGAALTGKTSDKLTFGTLQSSDAGSYTVVASNGVRTATNSPAAVLTVSTSTTSVSGQWDFNQGDLRATVGQPLQYFDAQSGLDTSFGTTTALGISDINGKPANVMFYTPSVEPSAGFIMPHGIAPNAGGTRVNQYTVIMDILYPSYATGYRSLWQTAITNGNDAEIFFNGGGGLGISSQYHGTLAPDEWHRVVFALDLTRRELGKYIDGVNVVAAPVGTSPMGSYNAQYLSASTDPGSGGGVDMRWSLGPTALLFADEDGEVQPVYVSSIQVRDGRMTDAEVAALGGPSAAKIPFIKATRSGSGVTIDWAGTILESAPAPNGPWTAVAGAGHPYVVNAPTGAQFYRVGQ